MASETSSGSYDAGCHCGEIRFTVRLSPKLEEYEILNCNCSICRRAGYLLLYPLYEDVTWHDNSKDKCGKYVFNTKTKDHLFCKTCGCSIGIDFREWETKRYGISARTIDGVDLDSLNYKKGDGINKVHPAADLSGGRS